MPVYIKEEELELFQQNGISREQIQTTVNNYRSDGLSDEQIRGKFDVKLNSFKDNRESYKSYTPTYNQNSELLQGKVEKSINLTPSGLAKNAVTSSVTPIMIGINTFDNFLNDKFPNPQIENAGGLDNFIQKESEGIPDNLKIQFQKGLNKVYEPKPQNWETVFNNTNDELWKNNMLYGFKNEGLTDFVVDTVAYSQLPIFNKFKGKGLLPSIGNNTLTGAYQGAVIGGLESLKNKGINKDIIRDTGIATSLGAGLSGGLTLTGLGLSSAINSKPFKDIVSGGLSGLTSVPKKYIDLALKKELEGNSIFKGEFNPDKAYKTISEKINKARQILPSQDFYTKKYKELGQRAKKVFNNKLIDDKIIEESFYNLGQRALKGLNKVKINTEKAIEESLDKFKDIPYDLVNINLVKKDIQNLVDSFSKNSAINPAFLRAKKEINEVYKMIDSIDSQSRIELLKKDKINYLSRIDKFKKGLLNKDELITISHAPKIWTENGLPDKQISISQEVFKKAGNLPNKFKKNHNLNDEILNNLPELLQAPLYIMKSSSVKNRYVGILDVLDNEGRPVLIAIEPSGGQLRVNIVPSLYGRNNFEQFLKREKLAGNILYQKATPSQTTRATIAQASEGVPDNIITDIEANSTPKNVLMGLHNIKEILYDMANYDVPVGIKNNAIKSIASKINQTLRKISSEYAKANDSYSLLKQIEYDAGGLNELTIGEKLFNYGDKSFRLKGLDKKYKAIDNILAPEDKFLADVINFQDLKRKQEYLKKALPNGIFNNISYYDRPSIGIESISALENLDKNAPKGLKFLDEYNTFKTQKAENDEILKMISSKYERNPKLLGNVHYGGLEDALSDLQTKSGINFMDNFDEVIAQDAFSKWLPGQGGGSGSGEGFANLVRSQLASNGRIATAALLGNSFGGIPGAIVGAGFVSPRMMGKGTIKNLGVLKKGINSKEQQTLRAIILRKMMEKDEKRS